MDISTWEYEEGGEGAGTTHIGPMAEDFHDAFDVGSSDEHINAINADGVAFAAIQGLSTELDERAERIDDLEAELDAKDARIEDQRDRIDRLESEVDALREENEQLHERNADMEARVERIEAELGLGGSDSTATPADD
jgi:septal ring factor EnvC (AmiA/AmiB activator)